jgi:hypothetical protein
MMPLRNDHMDMEKQQQLRYLAEQMAHATDPDQQTLATGTLELLDYVDELFNALEFTTETCFDAMQMVYEGLE